jgi:hypothetical protein
VLLKRLEQLTELALANALLLPPIAAEQRTLIEQVCAQLDLPLDKVFPVPGPYPGLQWDPAEGLKDLGALPGSASYDYSTDHQSLDSATLVNSLQSNPSMQFDLNNPADLVPSGSWEVSPSDWPWQLFSDIHLQYDVNGLPIDMNSDTVIRGDDATNTAATSDDEVETNIVPDLAARFGSLSVDAEGRVRFYGSASNQHLFANGSTQREDILSNQDKRREVALALENSQLDREIPEDLEERLLSLFFEWYNTCHSLVDRTLFEASRRQNPKSQSQYCSESLVAAM